MSSRTTREGSRRARGLGILGSVVAIATSIGSLVIAVLAFSISLCNRRDASRMFELQRRPWLKIGLANCRADTVVGLFWCDVTFKNVGEATAAFFVSQTDSGSTSREPVADTAGMHLGTKPAFPLVPGDEQSTAKRIYFDRARVKDDGYFYLHVRAMFEGTETEGTYYQEQVFFVRPFELAKMGERATSLGHERTYYGRLVKGRVVLSRLPGQPMHQRG